MTNMSRRLRRPSSRVIGIAALLVIAYGVLPFTGSEYLFDALLTPFLAAALAALGLNILAGYAGQLSLGSAAFMAIGAYTACNLTLRLPGVPFAIDIVIAGIVAAAIGLLFGLPSLRLRGFYLAVSTLALQFFVQWALNNISWLSDDNPSGVISTPSVKIGLLTLDSATGRYLFTLITVSILTFLAARLASSQHGRNFIAVRDNEVAAKVIGIPVLRTKLIAFVLSSFVIGVAGAVWSFAYLRTVEPDGFNLDRSFQILFIIIIGGLASIRGAFLGAALMTLFPLLLARAGQAVFGYVVDTGSLDLVEDVVIGTMIVIFLIAEPAGLVALFDRCWSLGARVLRQWSGAQDRKRPSADPGLLRSTGSSEP